MGKPQGIQNSFRGMSKLKGAGVPIEWTPELQLEYVKCSEDVFYFIEKYFMIIVEKGLQHMVLRDYQVDMIQSMLENRYTLAVMARQAGKTECFRAFLLWFILFHEHKTIAIVANKEKSAIEIITKLQISYKNLPYWLQNGVTEANKSSFVLENGSRLFASATSKDALRSYTVHIIIIDEAAHIDTNKWGEFYSAVEPTISAGSETKLIMASTPNGMNHFYEFYEGCSLQKNTNGFHGIYAPWWIVPGRDEAWKQETLQRMNFDMVKFSQEYEISFIGSSNSLIMGWRLETLKTGIKEPIFVMDNINVYEYP